MGLDLFFILGSFFDIAISQYYDSNYQSNKSSPKSHVSYLDLLMQICLADGNCVLNTLFKIIFEITSLRK